MSREERAQTRLAMTMAEDRQADFGTYLRLAREQRGLSLQELAVTTKISARLLEALERNDPSKLPGGIFSRSFVRAYAREVGLDPDATVARFATAFPNESGADEMPAATSAVEAESFEQRRRVIRIATRLLGGALIVAILAFIYVTRTRTGPARAEATRVQAPAASPRSEPPQPQSGPPPPQPAATALPEPSTAPPSRQVEAEAPAAPAAATPSAPAPLAVVLTFSDTCWVSVSVDGRRAPSKTVRAGERLEFVAQRSITMTIGDPAAVSVTLNGKPARALGAAGQVVTATMTAATYESFLR